MDTSRDYRILVAEKAAEMLERRVRNWGLSYPLGKRHVVEAEVREVRSLVLRIKHSYLPLEYLVRDEAITQLMSKARELAKALMPPPGWSLKEKDRLGVAEIRWCLATLYGLKARLLLGPENYPDYAVDVVAMEVGTVMKHPSNPGLRVTKAATKTYALTVVTNILNIKEGEVRAVAILPPKVFGGVVSEGMYSSDPLTGYELGKRVRREYYNAGEVGAMVEAFLKA